MIAEHDWKWFGNAAHFICADRCRFHLATQVGDWLISTVGELKIRNDDYDFEEIGVGRLYETMVFHATKFCTVSDCNCGMPIVDGHELDFDAYNTAKDANAGHLAMCKKWASIEGEEA